MSNKITWRLRNIMADRGLFQTTDLVEPLRRQGVTLSREQIFRLVTQPPQRLNIEVLAAVCTVLDCTPNDLLRLESAEEQAPAGRTGTGGSIEDVGDLRPVPARIQRPRL